MPPRYEKEAPVIDPDPGLQAARAAGAIRAPKPGSPELAPPTTQTQNAASARLRRRRRVRRRRCSVSRVATAWRRASRHASRSCESARSRSSICRTSYVYPEPDPHNDGAQKELPQIASERATAVAPGRDDIALRVPNHEGVAAVDRHPPAKRDPQAAGLQGNPDRAEPVREVVALGCTGVPTLGRDNGSPAAVARRKVDWFARGRAVHPDAPPVPACAHLEDGDANARAGGDAATDQRVGRSSSRPRNLVVEVVAIPGWKRTEADLDPFVGAAGALTGAADADPTGNVARTDAEPLRGGHDGRADARDSGVSGEARVDIGPAVAGHRRRAEHAGREDGRDKGEKSRCAPHDRCIGRPPPAPLPRKGQARDISTHMRSPAVAVRRRPRRRRRRPRRPPRPCPVRRPASPDSTLRAPYAGFSQGRARAADPLAATDPGER